VSSRLWGGALRDDAKNGCKGAFTTERWQELLLFIGLFLLRASQFMTAISVECKFY